MKRAGLHRLSAAVALWLGLAAAPAMAEAQASADRVAQGQYVARAADCAACHTAPGGATFAGGRAFKLPFGTLFSPNITRTGIARYSDEDWVRMLHQGIAASGKHLYPAMPYASYTGMTRDDALAIKAYLMSLPALPSTVPPNSLRFPFNQRWGMMFWNVLNNPDARFQPDPSKSADYNRGAYLATALGHCGECHTPRGLTMALQSGKQFAGAVQAGWLAYNLTADAQHGLGGWSDAALAQYLSTGHADGHGPASGPMAEAVGYSLRYLTSDDIHALVTYLRGVPAQPDGPAAAVPPVAAPTAPAPTALALGAHLFADACAGCHLPNGTGRQSAWAALAGSHSAADPAGTNIVAVLTGGTQIDTSQGVAFMHPFTGAYTDAELAAMANYTIARFGGQSGQVTPKQIGGKRTVGPAENAKPTS